MHLLKSKPGALPADRRDSAGSKSCRWGRSSLPPRLLPKPRLLSWAATPHCLYTPHLHSCPSASENSQLGSVTSTSTSAVRSSLGAHWAHLAAVGRAGGAAAPPPTAPGPEPSPPSAQTPEKLDPDCPARAARNAPGAPSSWAEDPGAEARRAAWRGRGGKKRSAPQTSSATSPSPGEPTAAATARRRTHLKVRTQSGR